MFCDCTAAPSVWRANIKFKPMNKKPTIADNSPDKNEPPQALPKANGIPELQPSQTRAEEEDLLAETRRTLLDEQGSAATKTGMFQKVKNRIRTSRLPKKAKAPGRTKTAKSGETREQEEAEINARASVGAGQETVLSSDKSILDDETQYILNVLDQAEIHIAEKTVEPEKESSSEHPSVDAVMETAHRILTSKPEKDSLPDYEELRGIALVDYQEPVPETIVVPRPSINRQVRKITKRINIRRLTRIATASLIILAIAAAFLIGSYLFKTQSYKWTQPTATPTAFAPTASPPIPMQIRLPGGWAFVLDTGAIVDGKWSPTGPEWLEGTEISKWISLPWSNQLDAVVRTLKAGDRIELVMTNYDHWLYRIRSIEEISANQMTSLDKNYPSLLLILTRADSDARLVILAVP